MSKEQIEEIWDILTTDCDRECVGCEFENDEWCFTHFVANKLYNAGYRKQSEPISCSHENGGGWISVEERLPKRWEMVLVFCDDIVSTDFISSKGRWYEHIDHEGGITHWMPLPEPPKMKGGE